MQCRYRSESREGSGGDIAASERVEQGGGGHGPNGKISRKRRISKRKDTTKGFRFIAGFRVFVVTKRGDVL